MLYLNVRYTLRMAIPLFAVLIKSTTVRLLTLPHEIPLPTCPMRSSKLPRSSCEQPMKEASTTGAIKYSKRPTPLSPSPAPSGANSKPRTRTKYRPAHSGGLFYLLRPIIIKSKPTWVTSPPLSLTTRKSQ